MAEILNITIIMSNLKIKVNMSLNNWSCEADHHNCKDPTLLSDWRATTKFTISIPFVQNVNNNNVTLNSKILFPIYLLVFVWGRGRSARSGAWCWSASPCWCQSGRGRYPGRFDDAQSRSTWSGTASSPRCCACCSKCVTWRWLNSRSFQEELNPSQNLTDLAC